MKRLICKLFGHKEVEEFGSDNCWITKCTRCGHYRLHTHVPVAFPSNSITIKEAEYMVSLLESDDKIMTMH